MNELSGSAGPAFSAGQLAGEPATAEQNPLFSIIVPTHDRPDLLAAALASVREQTEHSWQCIVVDDASNAAAVSPDDSRFMVIRHSTPQGPAAARNAGLAAAIGQFVCFLDDDDVFVPTRLASARPYLRPDCMLVHHGGEVGTAAVAKTTRWSNRPGRMFARTTPHLGRITIDRNIAPLFDSSLPASEDIDWLIRLSDREFRIVPTVGWLWRRHHAARGNIGTEARLQGSRMLLDKHQLFFAKHRSARAFRHYRMGLMYLSLQQCADARSSFVTCLRCLPAPRIALRALQRLLTIGRCGQHPTAGPSTPE